MGNPGYSPADLAEALRLVSQHGNVAEASRAAGIPDGTLRARYNAAKRDPAAANAMQAIGTSHPIRSLWTKVPPKDGEPGYSVFQSFGDDDGPSFLDQIREAFTAPPPDRYLPPRFAESMGDLLVLDPSDVHIGNLCEASETGYTYDIATAAHRLKEGSRILLERGKALGVTRVLLVIGNDIAHIDSPRRMTTSGTPQDTDGSIFSIYRAASQGYRAVVNTALEMGLAMDVVFCPSNHDWILGFTIAQELAAWFHAHPNFTATAYNISENHRKYYRFGNNLMVFTHGDGAKEKDLPQIMLVEARHHIAECPHRYAYLHHYHHRMRNALGVRPMQREKDHIAMSVSWQGAGAQEGDNLQATYVRSPSPPDGWHSRNGFLNRQAVEAFIHHPEDGRTVTLTAWF